jgi:tRNA-binding protein
MTAGPPNKGMKLTKPGQLRSFAAYPRCSTDNCVPVTHGPTPNQPPVTGRGSSSFGSSGTNEFKPAGLKPNVSMADVDKLDIRIGTIIAVDEVPNSVKLLRLTVDLGDHRRTILAGMRGERSDPQEIVGKQALFVVNLQPKRMAGELSEGMLFDLGYADGLTPALATPERPMPNGTRAG